MCVIISVRDAHVRSTLCIYRPITHNGSTVSNSTRIQYCSRSFVCSLSSISTATCMYRPYSTSEFLNTKLLPVFFQPTKLKWLVFEISSNALICRQL